MTPLSRLVRTIRWHRRLLAALLAAASVLLLATASKRPATPSADVIVVTHDLPAGARLAPGDLKVASYPVDLVPTGTISDQSVAVGHQLGVAATAGTPLTANSLLSAQSMAGKGEQLAPFRISDVGVANLLHVGDAVTVVASTSDNQVVTLAKRVRIAALPGSGNDSSLTGTSSSNGAIVVVSCDEKTATSLAAWAGSSQLGITLG